MIVAGMGCRATVDREALRAALTLCPQRPDALCTVAARAALPAMADLAQTLGIPLFAVPEAALSGLKTPTRSDRILTRFGTGSVAEAAALAALAPGARIVTPRVASPCGSATAALASGTLNPDLKPITGACP